MCCCGPPVNSESSTQRPRCSHTILLSGYSSSTRCIKGQYCRGWLLLPKSECRCIGMFLCLNAAMNGDHCAISSKVTGRPLVIPCLCPVNSACLTTLSSPIERKVPRPNLRSKYSIPGNTVSGLLKSANVMLGSQSNLLSVDDRYICALITSLWFDGRISTRSQCRPGMVCLVWLLFLSK